MAKKQPERKSAEGRVAEEHRSLDAMFAEARLRMTGARDTSELCETFAELSEAIGSHLIREEDLYYPAIWALRPAHKPSLLGFISAHERFRRLLGDVAARLEDGALEDAARLLEELLEAFARHEAEEEQELGLIDREIASSDL